MPRAYSEDLRVRLVREVEAGASVRAAAAKFSVSPSTVVKVVARYRRTGSAAPGRSRGCTTSKLDGAAGERLLALLEARPDQTVEELRSALAADGVRVGKGTVWRFFKRHGITRKKRRSTPPSRSGRTWRSDDGFGARPSPN